MLNLLSILCGVFGMIGAYGLLSFLRILFVDDRIAAEIVASEEKKRSQLVSDCQNLALQLKIEQDLAAGRLEVIRSLQERLEDAEERLFNVGRYSHVDAISGSGSQPQQVSHENLRSGSYGGCRVRCDDRSPFRFQQPFRSVNGKAYASAQSESQ